MSQFSSSVKKTELSIKEKGKITAPTLLYEAETFSHSRNELAADLEPLAIARAS